MTSRDEEYKDGPVINTGYMYVSLFFLWPIFPFLMLYRMSKHRNYTHKKISDCRLKGTFPLFFYLVYVFAMLSSEFSLTGLVAFSVIFLLPSLYQFHKAKRIKRKLLKRLEQYQNYLMENKVTLIERLGKLTGEFPEIVKNELRHWIYAGVLKNVDVRDNRVVNLVYDHFTFDNVNEPQHHHSPPKAVLAPPSSQSKMVQCHGCGASMTIMEWETKRCEYCDNIISWKEEENAFG